MSRSTYRTASPTVQEPGQINRQDDFDTYAPLGSYTSSPPRVDVPSWGPPLSTTLSNSRPTPLSVSTGGWAQDRPGNYGAARTAVSRARSTTGTQTEAPAVTYSPPSTISTISTASSVSSSSRSAHRQQTLSNPPNTGKQQPAPLEWENVFHPSFIPNIADFANEWSFTGLYTSHILFTQYGKQPPFKKLLIYNIRAQTTEITKVKYDTAGLGPGGVFLLYRQGYEMHLYDVTTGTTIKSASLRNLTRWSYNALGFCILDDAGNFWRWSFNDRLPPALVFRLTNRAPKARLRCLTTRDGSWNAIVAVARDRTEGLVHCYPTDNDESRVIPGVLAALMQTEIDGNRVTHIAVIEIDCESETEPTMIFTINQLGPPVPGAIRRVETRMPFEAVGGPPSAMFIDSEQAVAVVLITPPTDNYIAMLFDLRTGTFIMKQTVAKYQEDSWLVDDTGIFRERSGCVVQRLKILPEGLPPRVSAQPRGGLPPLSPAYSRAGEREHLSPVSPLSGQHSPQMPPRKLSLPVMANDVGVGY